MAICKPREKIPLSLVLLNGFSITVSHWTFIFSKSPFRNRNRNRSNDNRTTIPPYISQKHSPLQKALCTLTSNTLAYKRTVHNQPTAHPTKISAYDI